MGNSDAIPRHKLQPGDLVIYHSDRHHNTIGTIKYIGYNPFELQDNTVYIIKSIMLNYVYVVGYETGYYHDNFTFLSSNGLTKLEKLIYNINKGDII